MRAQASGAGQGQGWDSRRALALGGFVVAAAWVLLGGRSLWFDELFSLHAASLLRTLPQRPAQLTTPEQGTSPDREQPGGLVRFVRDHDAHPPLYYVLLRVWTGAFGPSERAVRALSGLLAVLTLLVVRDVARHGLGDGAAGLAVVAVAASPLFLQASVEATRYALLTFLYVVCAREVVGLVGGHGAPWRLAASAGLLLYTHYLAAVLLGALVLFAAWERRRTGLGAVAGPLVLAALAFSPWLPVFLHHVREGRFDPPWRPPLPPTLPLQVLHVVGFGGRVFGTASYFTTSTAPGWLELLLALPVALLVGLGLVAAWRQSPRLARLVACGAGVPSAALLGASLWKQSMVAYPRYFVFAVPFLALAVGAVGAARPARPGRVVRAAAAAAVLALAVASLWALAANPTQGVGDRRSLAQELRVRLQPGDVVVASRWESLGLLYYLPEVRGGLVQLPSTWTQRGREDARRVVSRSAAVRRVWMVQESHLPPGAFQVTYRQLARTHRVTYFSEFDGVRLTLFVRRNR